MDSPTYALSKGLGYPQLWLPHARLNYQLQYVPVAEHTLPISCTPLQVMRVPFSPLTLTESAATIGLRMAAKFVMSIPQFQFSIRAGLLILIEGGMQRQGIM